MAEINAVGMIRPTSDGVHWIIPNFYDFPQEPLESLPQVFSRVLTSFAQTDFGPLQFIQTDSFITQHKVGLESTLEI